MEVNNDTLFYSIGQFTKKKKKIPICLILSAAKMIYAAQLPVLLFYHEGTEA